MTTARTLGWTLLLAAGLFTIAGCGDDDPARPPGPSTEYREYTTPPNLVHNLEVSYRNREIDKYVDLLSSDFRFQLTPTDANDFGQEFFTFEEDSAGTEALFTTPDVSGILVDLPHSGATEAEETDVPAGSMKIRVLRTQLEVDTVDGTTFLVTSIQDFFFREGDESKSEDPDRWYLFEWREFPGTNAIHPGGQSAAIETTTWATVKAQFANSTPVGANSWGFLKKAFAPGGTAVAPGTWGELKSKW